MSRQSADEDQNCHSHMRDFNWSPLREHVSGYLVALIEVYRASVKADPKSWEKIPEPEKPFFGRKIIDE